MHAITQVVLPGELVFDIGANTGNKTQWFADRNVRVIAVEPQPDCVAHLRKRFSGNQMVTIVPKGVSDRPGVLELHISSQNNVLSTFSPEWKEGRFRNETWDKKAQIEVTTLDKLIEQFGLPRYAKIDVEGYERRVISGLSRKIAALSFEFTSEEVEDAEWICKRLRQIGYEYFNLTLGELEAFVHPSSWAAAEVIVEDVRRLIKNDSLLWGDIYAS